MLAPASYAGWRRRMLIASNHGAIETWFISASTSYNPFIYLSLYLIPAATIKGDVFV